jgi:methanogenic corrinoid protein MtbC1
MTAQAELLATLHKAVVDGDEEAAARLAAVALAQGVPALDAVSGGMLPGIQEAGRLWEEGEFFLPELVTAASAMKSGMAVLRPALLAGGGGESGGRAVVGTVEGDIHDIGKTLLATMLTANSFTVEDLGTSVPTARFLEAARALDADLVCASALLTTTMGRQRELVAAVKESGLRARVMVGGAPVTGAWATSIGADGWADNAVAAVGVARDLLHGHAR